MAECKCTGVVLVDERGNHAHKRDALGNVVERGCGLPAPMEPELPMGAVDVALGLLNAKRLGRAGGAPISDKDVSAELEDALAWFVDVNEKAQVQP